MTILTVMAMLGGITALLWLSAFIESRRLGPVGLPEAAAQMAGMEPVVEAVRTAA